MREVGDRIVGPIPADGGASLMILPAGKGKRCGQSLVKLVFDGRDVEGFCERCAAQGLVFGTIRRTDGYVFANAKDPSDNPISVSTRALRTA